MSAASVYFILGTPGSGRRAIVQDLVENGFAATDRIVVLVAGSEPADPADAKLAARAATTFVRWQPGPDGLPTSSLEADATVFLLADSRGDAVTQIESLKPWLARQGGELARIFCVVDCQFAERHAATALWFDACIHFSDVVLLTRRDGVENKWLSGFIRRYEEQFFPCHFMQVRKTGIANPALILEPQPRRVSQYFDEFDALPEVEIETDDEEPDDDDAETPPAEPYFERNRSGRRVKELPDVRAFYPA